MYMVNVDNYVKSYLNFAINITNNGSKKYRDTAQYCTVYCICNYILFTKLTWPGDSDGNFRSLSQAATYLPHAVETSHCPLNC